ncbi:BQ5605_C010g06121 [Microbotryum silenes-dioicae]|uniref:BQ5605_C010g06121 protein n=1 Tax=Microbotryum silenes-dioicae TaxID=796604 RepID=A0A2X0NMW6_9BASI|nr:BQ5605_C010g06121 [Microbotryum silenes-dioicae]
MAVKNQLVVFDFDWSFADQDTDRYVLEVLDPKLRVSLREHKKTVQWTDNVALHLRKLNEKGATKQQIIESLQGLPVHPAMLRGVQTAKARTDSKTRFLCLSNSNSVYINTILKHHNMENFFEEIITNPAEWKGNLLDLRRRVDPNGPQHGCKVGCSPNMCKEAEMALHATGAELDAYMARNGGWESYDRVVYVGDGGNDFCPLLRLRKGDVALVRMYRELSRRIVSEKETSPLQCTPVPWGGAWEVEKWLLEN